MTDYYETLRSMLDAHPSGAPPSPAINEILHLLFTEEEVKVAANMSFRALRLTEIARGSGLSEEETQRYLDAMLDKGVIVSRPTKKGQGYYLIPTASGLCEHSLQKAIENPLHARLRDLWKQYRDDGMIESMTNNTMPLMRVLPIEKILPVKSNILPYEVVSNLIRVSGTIAVYNCGCRIAERRCDAPIETCLVFGSVADFLIERSFARKITPEEALSILDETERAGLVHCGSNSADKVDVICNCCSCCCIFLRGLLELDNPHAVATSSYVASVNEALCNGCGICSDGRCQVGALMERDGTMHVQADKCLGCGLCASVCPIEAIELKQRDIPPETPPTIKDMALKVLTDKGKADAFLEIMMR